MKKVLLVVMLVVMAAAMMAQTPGTPTSTGAANAVAPTVDVLGAHNNYGRGCAGCHAPHSGARGAGGNGVNGAVTAPDTGMNALFAQDYGPLYGQTLNFGDVSPTNATGNTYQLITPATGTTLPNLSTQQYSDLRGILMCLACHDGNVAKGAMMQNYAYEQQIGALPSTYGKGHIPTLLGNDGVGVGVYNNDHPIGESATLQKALGAGYYNTPAGLTFTISASNAITAIAVGTTYSQFMSSYGAPAIMKGTYSYPTPVNASGVPYLVCTTCHDQHVMNVYAASANSPIAGAATGTYATYFFVNGPYNVNNVSVPSTAASSTTQFCRQCHFGESNEANGGSLTTSF